MALGQVVEREEVDERQVAQDVDDGAARVGLAHGARPRLVDLDALEEALVEPRQQRVGVVRDERAVHGLRLALACRGRAPDSVAAEHLLRDGHELLLGVGRQARCAGTAR